MRAHQPGQRRRRATTTTPWGSAHHHRTRPPPRPTAAEGPLHLSRNPPFRPTPLATTTGPCILPPRPVGTRGARPPPPALPPKEGHYNDTVGSATITARAHQPGQLPPKGHYTRPTHFPAQPVGTRGARPPPSPCAPHHPGQRHWPLQPAHAFSRPTRRDGAACVRHHHRPRPPPRPTAAEGPLQPHRGVRHHHRPRPPPRPTPLATTCFPSSSTNPTGNHIRAR